MLPVQIKDKELHRVAITAIIYRFDLKYLIVRRALDKKVYPGKWSIPGGSFSTDDYVNVQPDYDGGQRYGVLENALKREVREEVGLEIGKPQYLCDLALVQPDGTPIVVLAYYAPYVSGQVRLDNEAIDFQWVSADEAKNFDLIPGILDEIKMVDKVVSMMT